MSGGHFDYVQYRIEEVADQLFEESVRLDFPYSHDTRKIFYKTVAKLKAASVLLNRIDWLLSGDDGEETFHERLREDLDSILGEGNK